MSKVYKLLSEQGFLFKIHSWVITPKLCKGEQPFLQAAYMPTKYNQHIYGVNTQSSADRWTTGCSLYPRPLLAILVCPRMVMCIIITMSFVQIPHFIMLASIVFSYLGIQMDGWMYGRRDRQMDRWRANL